MDFNFIIDLITLLLLEIALGIDNVVFVSIIIGKLPVELHDKARKYWLGGALIMRALMLWGLGSLIKVKLDLLHIAGHQYMLKDVFMILGGLFLLAKATKEIHHKLEEKPDEVSSVTGAFWSVMSQIFILDAVFSLDFVITAIGMTDQIWVMIAAVGLSLLIMYFFAVPLSRFIDNHPTTKMLALSFLLLIGMTLLAEGFGSHVNKGYVYFAMFFSVAVEILNIQILKKEHKPVKINMPSLPENMEDKPNQER